MRKLIVNADDFGFDREVTDSIVQCHTKGVVTSTTMMANMPAAEYAARQAAELPELSVGVHLVLNGGRPVSDPKDIPALVDKNGAFFEASEAVRRAKRLQFPVEQIEKEFTAQVKRCLDLGITPTHCDSHHNITVNPQPCAAMIRVARKFNIPRLRTYRGWYRLAKGNLKPAGVARMLAINIARLPKQVYYEILHWYCRSRGFRLPGAKYGFYKVIAPSRLNFDMEGWRVLLDSLPDGVCELVAHPGLPLAADTSPFRRQRVLEHALFSDPAARELCRELDVELVNFTQV